MIESAKAVLVIVDVQGNLAKAVAESEERLRKIEILAEAAKLLEIPILLTAQVPEKIGHTVESLRSLLGDQHEFPRVSFNVLADEALKAELESLGRKQVILCGYETHICIYQSALAMVEVGFEVYLPADAISSRDLANKETALTEILRQANTHLANTELLLFALLKDARHPAFKAVSRLIR